MKLRVSVFVCSAALGLAALAPASPTQAQPPQQEAEQAVGSEVVVLHATNDGTGIDPKIGKMPELGKPPFSSYNSYKLLDRSKLSLAKGKDATMKLPNGSLLKIALKDVVAGKKKGEPKRFVVSTSIQKPGGNTFLPLLEVNAKAGELFFVAGQQHKGGILVLGMKVTP